MFWHDRETVNKLHHIGILDRLRPVLFDWGLVEAWRIRFVCENKSVIIGINANREVTFLRVDVRQKEMPRGSGPIQSHDQLLQELTVSTTGIWNQAKVTGTGNKEEDLKNIDTYWYLVESSELRMKITAEIRNGYMISLGTEQEILTDRMHQAVKKEYMESTLNLSGVLGSFVAVIAALLVLVFTEGEADLQVSLAMGAVMVIASAMTAKEDIELSIVNAYDARITVNMVYWLGILSTLLASLASGFVVFIGSLAGNFLSSQKELHLFEQTGAQIFSGISIGVASLGLFAVFFSVLERMGKLRMAPELSDRTVYLSGFTLKQGLSVSLQSSIAEETVYRLLAIPAIWWLSGNIYVGIGLSSMLWAFLHQGTGYHPRWIRWFQLFLFGWVLGLLYVYQGFLAVIVAHFIHNFLLVSMPLVQYKRQMGRVAVEANNQMNS